MAPSCSASVWAKKIGSASLASDDFLIEAASVAATTKAEANSPTFIFDNYNKEILALYKGQKLDQKTIIPPIYIKDLKI